jgi:alkylation response protein AidB-like acyl-CoA dehydrogenase
LLISEHSNSLSFCWRWFEAALSFTVGCKTEDGFTVILVERVEGVETKHIKTAQSTAAGTAYVTFDNVKVPVENTLGMEGGGIFVMLRYNIV